MTTKRLSKIFSWMSPNSKDRVDGAAGKEQQVITPSAANNWDNLPTFDKLPKYQDFDGCAWDVWGKDDELGTVNLLTKEVVKKAASEEIKLGRAISLNWPLQFPHKPLYGRKAPEVIMKPRPGRPGRDDEIHINTQSGSQWDGLRHFGLMEYGVFYNNVHMDTMSGGVVPLTDPKNIDPAFAKIGIQKWAEHGICGRGVLIDLVRYYTASSDGTPERQLPYDPWTSHAITVKELETVAAHQGVKFRQGDILLLRVGFIRKYMGSTLEERDALVSRPEQLAGIEQSDEMKQFLWNNHFAAVASDQPALERWPTPEGTPHLHQTLLGLWGMPIGEMFDLEKLSEVCAESGRYTFFFSSWPLAIIGGCASPPNAAAYF